MTCSESTGNAVRFSNQEGVIALLISTGTEGLSDQRASHQPGVSPNAGSERLRTGSLRRELVCVIIGRYGRVVDDVPGSGDRSSKVTFSDGNLHMDFTEQMVIFDHRPASLRNRVMLNPDMSGVLGALVGHRGKALSAEQLGEMVWGETNQEVATRTVKVVARLQMALGQMDLTENPIETVPGIGYRYQPLSR
jgi:DNA-binding response OmpR family regulator